MDVGVGVDVVVADGVAVIGGASGVAVKVAVNEGSGGGVVVGVDVGVGVAVKDGSGVGVGVEVKAGDAAGGMGVAVEVGNGVAVGVGVGVKTGVAVSVGMAVGVLTGLWAEAKAGTAGVSITFWQGSTRFSRNSFEIYWVNSASVKLRLAMRQAFSFQNVGSVSHKKRVSSFPSLPEASIIFSSNLVKATLFTSP